MSPLEVTLLPSIYPGASLPATLPPPSHSHLGQQRCRFQHGVSTVTRPVARLGERQQDRQPHRVCVALV